MVRARHGRAWFVPRRKSAPCPLRRGLSEGRAAAKQPACKGHGHNQGRHTRTGCRMLPVYVRCFLGSFSLPSFCTRQHRRKTHNKRMRLCAYAISTGCSATAAQPRSHTHARTLSPCARGCACQVSLRGADHIRFSLPMLSRISFHLSCRLPNRPRALRPSAAFCLLSWAAPSPSFRPLMEVLQSLKSRSGRNSPTRPGAC